MQTEHIFYNDGKADSYHFNQQSKLIEIVTIALFQQSFVVETMILILQ